MAIARPCENDASLWKWQPRWCNFCKLASFSQVIHARLKSITHDITWPDTSNLSCMTFHGAIFTQHLNSFSALNWRVVREQRERSHLCRSFNEHEKLCVSYQRWRQQIRVVDMIWSVAAGASAELSRHGSSEKHLVKNTNDHVTSACNSVTRMICL